MRSPTATVPDDRATVSCTLTFDRAATWSFVQIAAARAGVSVRRYLHDLVRRAALPTDLNPIGVPTVAKKPKSPNAKHAGRPEVRVSPASPNRPENIIQPLITSPNPDNPNGGAQYKGKVLTNTPTGNSFGKKPEGCPS